MAKLIRKLLQIAFSLAALLAFVQSDKLIENSRRLDEGRPPGLDQSKCGNCPCDKPCSPPSSPPPPPPTPSPPPPPKKSPPSTYCPPPPSGGGGGQYPPSPPYGGGGGYPPSPPYGGGGGGGGGGSAPTPPYAYVNGPPGNVYQVYPYVNGSGRSFSVGLFTFLISSILLLGMLAF